MSDPRYLRERRAAILVTAGMAGVFWTAFGILGCGVTFRDALLKAAGGSLPLASALAALAYLAVGAAVLGPMGYLLERAHPATWGLDAPSRSGWLASALRRLLLAALAAAPGAVLLESALLWRTGLSWLWITLALAVPVAWTLRRRGKAAAWALAGCLLLGAVAQGLLDYASLRGLWGITGREDLAAWPLLGVVLTLVAAPGILLLNRKAAR